MWDMTKQEIGENHSAEYSDNNTGRKKEAWSRRVAKDIDKFNGNIQKIPDGVMAGHIEQTAHEFNQQQFQLAEAKKL